jgi:hypothetical protein
LQGCKEVGSLKTNWANHHGTGTQQKTVSWPLTIHPSWCTGSPVSGPGRLGLACYVFICTHLHIWLLFGWKKWRNQDLSSLSYESIHMSPSFIAYFILIMSVPTPNYTWKLRRVLSCYTHFPSVYLDEPRPSTHQPNILDGWCVEGKHFFILFLSHTNHHDWLCTKSPCE